MWRTVDRLARLFAYPVTDSQVDVYTEAPPLSVRHLATLPPSVQESHDRLLTAHLLELGLAPNTPAPPPARAAAPASLSELAVVGSTNGASGRSL